MTIWNYDGSAERLEGSGDAFSPGWHLLELPVGFCVFDVLVVKVEPDQVPKVFGVQITISKTPFAAHDTHDTCRAGSTARIAKLKAALQATFETDEIVYVMFAPKAAEGSFAAHGHEAAYYFAPPEKIGGKFAAKKARKRTQEKCCHCTNGSCNNCKCGKNNKQCTNCGSSGCANGKSAKKDKK
jgi:hypothetical protein